MHHVLVAGDDKDIVLLLRGLARQRADHIVRLKAFGLKNRNAQRLKRAANVGYLPAQILWHGLAIGLVALVVHILKALRLRIPLAQRADGACLLVAEDFAAHLEDSGEIFRRKVLAQLLDHVDEDVGGRGGQAGARGHGAAALHGVVSAEDERHRVQQKNGLFVLVGHVSECTSERG